MDSSERALDHPARLSALRRLQLMDAPREPSFDRLTRLVARFLNAPVCLVSLVDDHRQFFVSAEGLGGSVGEARQTPLTHSFCQHVVTSGQPLVVCDARTHPRVCDNLAIRDLGVQAYLGLPLTSPDGYVLGSFCVIDSKPRDWSPLEIELMTELTHLVATEISLRHESIELRESEEVVRVSRERVEKIFRSAPVGMVLHDATGAIVEGNASAQQILGLDRDQMLGVSSLDPRWQTVHEDGSPFPGEEHPAMVSLRTGSPQRDVVMGVRRGDGSLVWVQVNSEPICCADGSVSFVVVSFADITERKEALEQVARAERLTRIVTDGLPGMAAYWTRDLRCSFANKAYLEWFGREPGAMVGISMRELLGEDLFRVNEPYIRGALAGERQSFERKLTKADGSVGYTWAHYMPDVAEDGVTVRGFVVLVSDITGMKLKDAALRESEERMRLFAAYAPASVAMFDREMRYLVHSARWLRDYRLGEQDLIGRSHYEVFPEIGESWKAIHRRCLAGKTETCDAARFERADGSVQWLSWRVQPWHDGSGAIGGIVMFTEDITERVRISEELRLSREQLQAAVLAADIGVFEHDHGEDTLYWSPQQRVIFGLSQDEPASLALYLTFLHREDKDRIIEAVRRAHDPSGDGRFDIEHRIVRRDGSVRWIVTRSKTEFTGTGSGRRPVRTIGAVVDVTERKELEAQLTVARDQALEASRLKSEFLANMSHEIRTPMNGVIGMASMLAETRLDDEQQEMTRVIVRSADSLLGIINDVLDFSKIEAGKLRIEREEFDLRQVIDDTLALLAPRAHAKRVELACVFDEPIGAMLIGDSGRICQVLTNLVGNAIKFTERGEVVVRVSEIRVLPEQTSFRVTVRDTGIGIPAEAQGRLFQAFTQADGSTTRKYGGTGLGLAISRQLVTLMGGEIGFESAEGVGTTFWFTLGLPRSEGPLVEPAALPRDLRVLIVDDNTTNRNILLAQLAHIGIAADAAKDAAAALARLSGAASSHRRYHLVLLDWHMPQMDGMQLARAIRNDPALAECPLVMLSSAGPAQDEAAVAAIGYAAFLTKPVPERVLHRTIERIVGRPAIEPGRELTAVPTTHRKLKLLVAEDNPANQMVIQMMATKLGHSADVVGNGVLALQRLAVRRYDAVLMDCQMPELDGYETTRRLRSGAASVLDPKVPVIALTAYAMADDRGRCLAAGMDDYLTKPLRARDLCAVLRRNGLTEQVDSTVMKPEAENLMPELSRGTDADSELLDHDLLESMRGLPGRRGPSLLPELIAAFRNDEASRYDELYRLSEARDGSALAHAAHAFAGSCAAVGAVELRSAVTALEHAAKAGAWMDVPSLLTRILDLRDHTAAALSQVTDASS